MNWDTIDKYSPTEALINEVVISRGVSKIKLIIDEMYNQTDHRFLLFTEEQNYFNNLEMTKMFFITEKASPCMQTKL